jgi:hypothetical protein
MKHAGIGVYESRHEYEQEVKDGKYFWQVINAYRAMREMSPLAAINYDPFSKQKKLVIPLVVFLADVDIVTRKTLKTPELLKQWKKLVAGEEIPQAAIAKIIGKCARTYKQAGLAPVSYFKHIKVGRKDRRPVLNAAEAA